MLISLHTQVRRHRRKALTALAVLGVAAVALTAYSALAGGGMGHHTADASAICLTVGSCVAVIGVAAFALRRPLGRLGNVIAAPLAPELPLVPVHSGLLIRAGPPPLLQVFQL